LCMSSRPPLSLHDALPIYLDSIVVPFGGGGLSAGIAIAVKSQNPNVRVYACEPETAAPLAASYSKGSAQEINRTPSFVDGIGGKDRKSTRLNSSHGSISYA